MIKQVLITSIAAAGLLVSAQASAHSSGSATVWINGSSDASHGHSHSHHVKPARRPAPPKPYNVNHEQRQQAVMIKQGVAKCLITPREAKKIGKKQSRIKRAESRMRSSGHGLSYNESMKLKKRLHEARVQINSLTQNSKTCIRHTKKRSKKYSKKRAHKPTTYFHSHAHKQHSHTKGNRFHSHSNWSFSNDHGSFSIAIGH